MGAASRAASVSSVAVLNAGDGVGEHPTQALLDLYTIRHEAKSMQGLVVTMLGDLKNGSHMRTTELTSLVPMRIFSLIVAARPYGPFPRQASVDVRRQAQLRQPRSVLLVRNRELQKTIIIRSLQEKQ